MFKQPIEPSLVKNELLSKTLLHCGALNSKIGINSAPTIPICNHDPPICLVGKGH